MNLSLSSSVASRTCCADFPYRKRPSRVSGGLDLGGVVAAQVAVGDVRSSVEELVHRARVRELRVDLPVRQQGAPARRGRAPVCSARGGPSAGHDASGRGSPSGRRKRAPSSCWAKPRSGSRSMKTSTSHSSLARSSACASSVHRAGPPGVGVDTHDLPRRFRPVFRARHNARAAASPPDRCSPNGHHHSRTRTPRPDHGRPRTPCRGSSARRGGTWAFGRRPSPSRPVARGSADSGTHAPSRTLPKVISMLVGPARKRPMTGATAAPRAPRPSSS